MMGEASVASALKNLDNNYLSINDLKLKGKMGNIDHIIRFGINGKVSSRSSGGLEKADWYEGRRSLEG